MTYDPRDYAPDPIECESCKLFDAGDRAYPDCPGYPPSCEAVGEEYCPGNCGGGDDCGGRLECQTTWTNEDFRGVLEGWRTCAVKVEK